MSAAEDLAASITPQEIVDALRTFPSNGKPPANERAYIVWMHMEAVGLIDSRAQEEPCRSCGKPRVAYSYHYITPAGRCLLAAVGNAQ